MLTIHKFPLKPHVYQQTIEIPSRFQIVSLQLQDEIPCLWAMVETEYPLIVLWVHAYQTGETIPHRLEKAYVGTYQLDGYVYHVFTQRM